MHVIRITALHRYSYTHASYVESLELLAKIGTFGTSVTLYRVNIIRSPKLYLHSDTSPQDIPRI